MIRIANNKDNAEIKLLLEECFTQDQHYLDLFLNRCPYKIILVKEVDGRIVSMLTSFAINYISTELTEDCFHKTYHGAYLYGICTTEKYRKRGYCSQLIEYFYDHAKHLGWDFLILRPENSSVKLIRFYQSLGFNIPIFRAAGLPPFEAPINISKYTPVKLFLLRKHHFVSNYFEWGHIILSYIIAEATINPTEEMDGSMLEKTFILLRKINNDFNLSSNEAVFSYPME